MKDSPLDYSVLNQEIHEIEHLKSLSQKDKLPPVLLFHGRGSLQKSLVVAKLCAFLVCNTKEACGQCQNCLAFKQNKHPSILFVDNKERIITVEETSAIKKHLSSASGTSGDPRIVFIRDVERLSEQSTNKLLKAFEELVPFSFIFMTTERRHSLLDTLLSRSVPYLLKVPTSEPIYSEKVHKLASLFRKEAFSRHYAEVYELCEKLKKDKETSLEDILEAKEIAINQSYKSLLEQNSHEASKKLAGKRKRLAHLRKVILDKKIKLNKALVLESLLIN